MFLDGVLVGRDVEVLGVVTVAVDAVGEAKALLGGAETVEGIGAQRNVHGVGAAGEFGGGDEVFGIGMGAGILEAKAGDLFGLVLGKEHKVMTETGDRAGGFEIARVDEELDAIAAGEIGKGTFFKRLVHFDLEEQALFVVGTGDVGKGSLVE